ncbi:MAG: hypothetical protein M3144_08020, partial [Actinomycetota bacterium]|nr:hypothetical protein [Actinomycetota bacterium]
MSASGPWDEPGTGGDGPVQAASGRRDEVRRALISLVRRDREVLEDDERLDGYLRDLCPHQPAEVSVVVVAARGGVPHDLTRATEGHPLEAVSARLASRLHAEAGIDQELARWAVDTWAIALGKAPESPEAAFADDTPPV